MSMPPVLTEAASPRSRATKSEKEKRIRDVERSANDRATRLARWFQGRRRSGKEPRLIFV